MTKYKSVIALRGESGKPGHYPTLGRICGSRRKIDRAGCIVSTPGAWEISVAREFLLREELPGSFTGPSPFVSAKTRGVSLMSLDDEDKAGFENYESFVFALATTERLD